VIDWTEFDAALEQYQGEFWWRDDDAVADTPQLQTLLTLADDVGAPLTLAVIPAHLDKSLPEAIKDRNVTVAVHGWSHTNHAPVDEKKAEFRAHRPEDVLLDEAKQGKYRLDEVFGAQSLPVFIPPWNRLDEDLPLADIGYRGVSVFGQRALTRNRNLLRFDAHIDPIDWRGTRSVVAPKRILANVIKLMGSNEPIGLMTHHLVHDDAIWDFLHVLVSHLKQKGAKWTSGMDLLTRASQKTSLG